MNKFPLCVSATECEKTFFSVIIRRFGNAKTANEKLLHDRISQHILTYVDKQS